jgi:hypothetical protein
VVNLRLLTRGHFILSITVTAVADSGALRLTIPESLRRKIWAPFGIATKTIRLVQGGNVIESLSYSPGQAIPAVDLRFRPGWLRLEGYGDLGAGDKPLFFSSPVCIA